MLYKENISIQLTHNLSFVLSDHITVSSLFSWVFIFLAVFNGPLHKKTTSRIVHYVCTDLGKKSSSHDDDDSILPG
jgi:hypothetical protein